jgi:hypothetical protein
MLVSQVVIVVLGGSSGFLPVLLDIFAGTCACLGSQLMIVVFGCCRGLPSALPRAIGLLWPRIPSAALAWWRWPPRS